VVGGRGRCMSHARGLCVLGHCRKYVVVLQCIGRGLSHLESRSSIPSLRHLIVNACLSGITWVTYLEACWVLYRPLTKLL
jgi:hypothetical protein